MQTRYNRYDFPGRVIGPWQRPLPDNTQHPQETDMHVPVGFGPTIPTSKWGQIHALDNAATGTGPRKQLLNNKPFWVVMACRFIPQKLLKS